MGLLDKLTKIGNAIDQVTKYTGTQPEQVPAKTQEMLTLGQNLASTLEENTGINNILPVPLSEIVMLGGTFATLAPSLKSLAKDVSRNGMSAIPLKSIAQDTLKQAGVDVTPVTDALNGNGQNGWIQAIPEQLMSSPVPLDPATMMMAAMLVVIERKLDQIEDTQKSILDFLEKDKQAEQRANLKFLSDTLSGYKYNWDNDQYKRNHHVKALDIKQAADKNTLFYYSRILDELEKTPSMQMEQAIRIKISNLESMMNEYRMAIYQFGFSSFLEMLLLGNFNQQYLNQVAERIVKYNNEYKTVFNRCVDVVKKFSESSVQTRLRAGLGNLSKAIGNWASNTDVLKEKSVDRWFQDSSDKLQQNNDAAVNQNKALFSGNSETGSEIFVDSIRNIAAINNQTKDISFDSENIYLIME